MGKLLIEQLADELDQILYENEMLKIENEKLKEEVESHHKMVKEINANSNKLLSDIIIGGFLKPIK